MKTKAASHEAVVMEQTYDPNVLIPDEHQINLSDFALFLSVMKNPRAYTDVLSIVLDEPDLELSPGMIFLSGILQSIPSVNVVKRYPICFWKTGRKKSF